MPGRPLHRVGSEQRRWFAGIIAVVCLVITLALALAPVLARRQAIVLTQDTLIGAERTVAGSERGLIFGVPHDGDWGAIGAYVGIYSYTNYYAAMRPEALKVSHGEFHVVNREGDQGLWPYLSYERLTQLDAQERAAGRAPILITAAYNGTRLPVYWNWSVGFVADGQVAQNTPGYWKQAINVGSQAYIDYWVDEYVKARLYNSSYANWWIGLDECSFRYSLYGVVDPDNRYHTVAHWDDPFPKDETEYLASVKTFLAGVRARMPELKLICNDGGQETQGQYEEIYRLLDGAMEENMGDYLDHPEASSREDLSTKLYNLTWLAQHNKPVIACFILHANGEIPAQTRTAYATYLLTRGANSFFCPLDDRNAAEMSDVPPAVYAPMQAALGLPIGALQRQQVGDRPGYTLYSRPTERGIVYLNYTGQPQAVELPTGAIYHDREGRVIESLTIPDLTGDYVTLASVTAILAGSPQTLERIPARRPVMLPRVAVFDLLGWRAVAIKEEVFVPSRWRA